MVVVDEAAPVVAGVSVVVVGSETQQQNCRQPLPPPSKLQADEDCELAARHLLLRSTIYGAWFMVMVLTVTQLRPKPVATALSATP